MLKSNNSQDRNERYYVYGHFTKTSDKLFYVGVGTSILKSLKEKSRFSRAYHFHNRTKFWKNVVEKHGIVVKILSTWNTKEESLKEEARLVALHGRRFNGTGSLVNLSSGGEIGPVGRSSVISEAQRQHLSDLKSIYLYVYNSEGMFLKKIRTIKETAKFCGVTYNAIHSCMKTKNYSNGYFIFREYKGESLTYKSSDLDFSSPLRKQILSVSPLGLSVIHYSLEMCAKYLGTSRINLRKALKDKRLCKKHKVSLYISEDNQQPSS